MSCVYNYNPSYIYDNKISISKEIARCIIIDGLNNYFIIKLRSLKDYVDITELLKNESCKLIELINRWCWHQYNNKCCCDPVIPYIKDGKYNYDRFLFDLNYILHIKDTNKELTNDNIIIMDLEKSIADYLEVEYKKFNTLQDDDSIVVNRRNFDNKIRLEVYIQNNTYFVMTHPKVYARLKIKLIRFGQKFSLINTDENIDNLLNKYIFCLLYRYSYLDSGNQQLSIHHHIKEIYKECGVDFELFGSAINTLSTYYCSLFYDIEKYFGSQGNFFDMNIESGIYWCNPPYDDTIMTNSAQQLVKLLDQKKNICLLVTIPIWDKHTQFELEKINFDNNNTIIRNFNINTMPNDHIDFGIYSLLKPFIKDELLIPKHRIPYFNYKKYSSINAVNTYMLIVYNNFDENIAKQLHEKFDEIVKLDQINFFIKS